MRGHLLHRGDDVRQVGIASLAQRCRHADVDGVDAAESREVRRRRKQAGIDRGLHLGRRHVADVRFAALDGGGPFRVDIEADRRHAGAGERDDQRQADVTETDHARTHVSRGNALQQGIGHGERV